MANKFKFISLSVIALSSFFLLTRCGDGNGQNQLEQNLNFAEGESFSPLETVRHAKSGVVRVSSVNTSYLTESLPRTQPFALAEAPESPLFRAEQQFHAAEPIGRTTPQYYKALRPTIPSLRTSHDGRIGFGWGTGLLYLLSPEKIKSQFVLSKPSLDILIDPKGSPTRATEENFLLKKGEPWSFAGVTICNHVPREQQPRKCGSNDCYDLTYMGFYLKKSAGSGVKDLAYFRSRKVVIEVAKPKTAAASIKSIQAAPGSVLREKAEPFQVDTAMTSKDFQSFEPVATSDGRLYVSRVSGLAMKNSGGNPNKTVDIYYLVAPLSAEPCDASSFSSMKRMPRAHYDPEMRNPATMEGRPRYGIAEYPMLDSFGQSISEDAHFPTYPWIDRAGNNLFFSTGGSTLYTFPWQFQNIETAEPGRFVGDWVMLPESERYPSRCLQGFPDCKQNKYNPEDRGGVRGIAVLGSWTRGKTVVFDGRVNHTDYGLKRGPRYHREVQLYQPESDFDGYMRIGSGRENGQNGNGITNDLDSLRENSEIRGMGGPTGTVDSLENIFNTYRFLRPSLPRDTVWTINNAIDSDEVVFDDSLDNKALIVSSMVAGAEFMALPWWHDEWKYADGFTRRGDGAKDQQEQPVLIQNAATSPNLPLPAYGYLNKGRIEPIALGGIQGRGLWLDGTNALSYTFPRPHLGTELFFSLFFDNRSPDETPRQLVEFPDGTQIFVNSQSLRFQKAGENHSVSFESGKKSWNHLAVGVSTDNRVVTIYLNGMKYQTFGTSTPFFRISDSLVLRVGKSEEKTTLGFRGWIDEVKLFAYLPSVEVICNHAFGSLYWVKNGANSPWAAKADHYPAASHLEIYRQLPEKFASEKGIFDNSRFVCGANYSNSTEIYKSLAREEEGLVSLREVILFAVPAAAGSTEDGRISWNGHRTDFRGNGFCLSCHATSERRGLGIAALDPGTNCSMVDPRRQPFQPPVRLMGQVTNELLSAISSTPEKLLKLYENKTQALLVDPMLLPKNPGDGVCGEVKAADIVVTDIKWSPVSPANGELVTITVTVKNMGDIKVQAGTWMGATLSFNDNPSSWAGAKLKKDLLPQGTFSFATPSAQRWQAQLGTWKIMAHADDQGVILEKNESNNSMTQVLTVGKLVQKIMTPPKLAVLSPAHGAGNVENQPVIKWKTSGDVDALTVEISTSPEFTSFWTLTRPPLSTQAVFNGPASGWMTEAVTGAPESLTGNQTYYLRIGGVYDSGKQINYSPTVKFRVKK
ncbi:MAG: hypothetical protein RJB66_1306 [Pseudomonadota bacterium]|jgi:hypothetical protein